MTALNELNKWSLLLNAEAKKLGIIRITNSRLPGFIETDWSLIKRMYLSHFKVHSKTGVPIKVLDTTTYWLRNYLYGAEFGANAVW